MRIAHLFAAAALAAFALPAAAIEDAQTTKPSEDAVVSPAANAEAADVAEEKKPSEAGVVENANASAPKPAPAIDEAEPDAAAPAVTSEGEAAPNKVS
jgi:hypothetical protein